MRESIWEGEEGKKLFKRVRMEDERELKGILDGK
jgi:hypothetical protein